MTCDRCGGERGWACGLADVCPAYLVVAVVVALWLLIVGVVAVVVVPEAGGGAVALAPVASGVRRSGVVRGALRAYESRARADLNEPLLQRRDTVAACLDVGGDSGSRAGRFAPYSQGFCCASVEV